MGIGCINAIHKAGLRVPEDMAVIVKVELDTYWAMRGGVDQVQYLQKLGERCELSAVAASPMGMQRREAHQLQKGQARVSSRPALFCVLSHPNLKLLRMFQNLHESTYIL